MVAPPDGIGGIVEEKIAKFAGSITNRVILCIGVAVVSNFWSGVVVGQRQTRDAHPSALNRVSAAKLVQQYLDSTQPQLLNMPVDETANVSSDDLRSTFLCYGLAEKMGWIVLRPEADGTKTFIGVTDAGRKLFEGGRSNEARMIRKGQYQFVQARLSLRRITGIRFMNPNEAIVEFMWTWKPSQLLRNVIGETQEKALTARLLKYDDGWRVKKLDAPQ